MFAVRNLRLCTKDCLCLYVCPTGAADTETGQVDREKCTGCGACVSACPSHALSLMPDTLPPPQPKAPEVREELAALARSKAGLERAAAGLAASPDPVLAQLGRAAERACRLMAEDLMREGGYMLPQGEAAKALLRELLEEEQEAAFPRPEAEKLLKLLEG